jgi:hypothetical protein
MAIEQQPVNLETVPPPRAEPVRSYRWYHHAAALVFVFCCFEVGIILVFMPWLDWWPRNYFAALSPTWYEFWSNTYLRGAVSGLGLVNVAIAFSEMLRLKRFRRR